MKSILDPGFKYTDSSRTDVKKTFARIRREQREEAERQRVVDEAEKLAKVRTLTRKVGK